MDAEQFTAVSHALCGPALWKTALAGELGIAKRSVFNYATGARAVPEPVRQRLLEALRLRRDTINALLAELQGGNDADS